MTFTGADLYRAFNVGDEDAVPWSAVSRDIQDLHTCAAAIVQQTHIGPLQELVRDMSKLLDDKTVFEFGMFVHETQRCLARAKSLLGEGVS